MADRIQTATRGGALTALALAAIAAATTVVNPAEGLVLHTYPDAVYLWKLPTACRGHTGPELHQGQTFTVAECDAMEAADLRKTYDALAPCFGGSLEHLNPNQLGAFLSLGFNIGAGAVCRSSIPRKVQAGNVAAACATIEEFDLANKKDCHVRANNCFGVIERRHRERALCELPT